MITKRINKPYYYYVYKLCPKAVHYIDLELWMVDRYGQSIKISSVRLKSKRRKMPDPMETPVIAYAEIELQENIPAFRAVDFNGNLLEWDNKFFGIAQTAGNEFEVHPVQVFGIAQAQIDDDVTKGQGLSVADAGKLVPDNSLDWIVAFALEDGVADDVILVKLFK